MNRVTMVKVKRIVLALIVLSGAHSWAQVPPGGPISPLPRPGLPGGVPGGATSPAPQGSMRRNSPFLSRHGTNSIVVPSGPTNVPGGLAVPVDADTNLTAIVPPPGRAKGPEEMLPEGLINFQQADLNQVLELYAKLVRRTILRPASLTGANITLKTVTPLTQSEAVQALDSVLAMNGITMIDVGDKFVKAVQEASAQKEAEAFSHLRGDQLPELGAYLTHVVQLRYVLPTHMQQVLQQFAKAPNAILPIDESGILVLRDYAENIKRMLEMIREIDVALPTEFVNEVIPIKYALASDIASALNSLSSAGGGASSVSSRGTATRQGMGMSGGMMNRGTMGGMGGIGGAGGMYPGMSGYGSGTMGMNNMNNQANTANQGNSLTSRIQGIISRASQQGEIQILGQTKILADERTNSLLVYASKEDMKTIKDIISKLDIVLAQVLIETVIMEVNVDDSQSLGVSYQELQSHGVGNYFQGIGAINNGNSLTPGSFSSGLSSLASNATSTASSSGVPGGFSYLGAFGNDLNVTVTAIAAHTHGKILQCPRIQTSNAKQASLFVGETVPYPSGSYYGGGAYGGYSSIQQMQIGVSIDVTPLINPDGLVVMDIHQKIDDVQSFVNIANVGNVPVTSSKEAMTTVSVRDHDTIILGGLISDNKTSNNSGVPILKDIPLLGALFRSTSKDDTRDELIVLIRPNVLPTPEVAALTATAERHAMPEINLAEHEWRFDDAVRNIKTEQSIKAQEKKLKEYQEREAKKKHKLAPVYDVPPPTTPIQTNGRVNVLLNDKSQNWQNFDPKTPPPAFDNSNNH